MENVALDLISERSGWKCECKEEEEEWEEMEEDKTGKKE